MPRKTKNVEFMNTLFSISRHSKVSTFAKACGKQTSNMTRYLSGDLEPGDKVVQSSVEHLFGWSVTPLMEMHSMPDLRSLPTDAGVYVIYDSSGQVLYVGKATNFRAEVAQTMKRHIPVGLRFGPYMKKSKSKIAKLAAYLSLYEIPSSRSRHNFEALLLRIVSNQTFNSNIGKFK